MIYFIFLLVLSMLVNDSSTNKGDVVNEDFSDESGFRDGNDSICDCMDGIGSYEGEEPIHSFLFSNDRSLILCGYKADTIFTEFEIFDCEGKVSVGVYDVTNNYRINFISDTLRIEQLKLLPYTDWKWREVTVATEKYTVVNGEVKSIGWDLSFVHPKISRTEVNDLLDDIKMNKNNGLQHDWNWEIILGKLETLSLMGNERAVNYISQIEVLTNYKLTGADKEQYNYAIELLKRVRILK